MDWLWQLIDSLQKSGLAPVLQKLSMGDWLLFFSVLWGTAIGIKKGASEMFAKTFGLLLTGVVVLSFYERLALTIVGIIPSLPAEVARPVAYLLLTAFVWFSVSGCLSLLGKFFHVESHGALKSVGGMCLGAFYFLLLISLIAQFLLFIPSGGLKRYFSKEHSFTGPFVAGFLPGIQKSIIAPLSKDSPKAAKSAATVKT